jgi:hypothetical protein
VLTIEAADLRASALQGRAPGALAYTRALLRDCVRCLAWRVGHVVLFCSMCGDDAPPV